MKRLSKTKKLIAALMAVALLCLVPGGYTMKVEAASDKPVTFAVKYVDDGNGKKDWRYQEGTSTFDDSKYDKSLYYLRLSLREGDYVVVYNSSDTTEKLDLGSTPLGNLTVVNTAVFTSIHSGDIENCYILTDANCAINADVKNAYIYGDSLTNFNGDVEELQLMNTKDKSLSCTVGCGGVVHHLYAESSHGRVYYDLYDFDEASFEVRDGVLTTKKRYYSTSPKVEITFENFDYMRYADDYPDVRAVFGYDKKALYNHYITNGVKEGRLVHAVRTDFDYKRYADDYPDLKAAFGYDEQKLYNHYITNGINEKRVAYDTSKKVFRY